jgi:hypothetical protein
MKYHFFVFIINSLHFDLCILIFYSFALLRPSSLHFIKPPSNSYMFFEPNSLSFSVAFFFCFHFYNIQNRFSLVEFFTSATKLSPNQFTFTASMCPCVNSSEYVHLRFVDFALYLFFQQNLLLQSFFMFLTCPLQDKKTDNRSKKI